MTAVPHCGTPTLPLISMVACGCARARGQVTSSCIALVSPPRLYTSDVYEITVMKARKRRETDRTNIVLDAALVNRVKRLAKVRTTRDAVHVALDHYVRSRDYSAVLALKGSGGVAEGYDPKAVSPAR